MTDQADGLRELFGEGPTGSRLLGVEALAVASGKGGVGKTFVAANLAVLAAQEGRRVLLIDGDLGLANVDIALGVRARHTIVEVLRGEVSLADALVRGPAGIHLLAAGSGAEWLAQLDGEGGDLLRSELDRLAEPFDLVIVDCAAGIGRNVRFFARAAGRVVLTLTPEPTALADAYALTKGLVSDGVSDIRVVVNQALSPSDARDAFGRLRVVTARFLTHELTFLGGIPRDEDVRRSIRARQPLVSFSPACRAADALARLHALLRTPGAIASPGGWWDRIFSTAGRAFEEQSRVVAAQGAR